MATTINLGILEHYDELMIKIKPVTQINSTDLLTQIRFTLRWKSPTLVLTMKPFISPYKIQKEGLVRFSGGYYYQTFTSASNVPFNTTIAANKEVTIAVINYQSSIQDMIYINNDSYILDNHIEYSFIVNGVNATGSFHRPQASISDYIEGGPNDIGTVGPVTPNKIDAGIFTSTLNKRVVKIRPGLAITGDQTVTGIIYSVGWTDPGIVITSYNSIAPYYLYPMEPPRFKNGYYIQTFASVPMEPIGSPIALGAERIIASFSYRGNANATFVLINNSWTNLTNGNLYLELMGIERTGKIYRK